MSSLRKPLFIIALVLSVLIVSVETGYALLSKIRLPGGASGPAAQITASHLALLSEIVPGAKGNLDLDLPAVEDEPPGLAIRAMALVDGFLLFTIALIGVGLAIRERIQGRVQGLATLVVSLLLVIGAIALILKTLAHLLIMVGMLLAVPFGTLAYMALYGFFDRGGAQVALSVLMGLKIGLSASLILAQQRFLQNKGLVLLILTSMASNLIVGLLQGIVPLFLVSITDAIAAIVVAILAVLWGIVMLVGALVSIVKMLRLSPA
jgi:hypothetical protein